MNKLRIPVIFLIAAIILPLLSWSADSENRAKTIIEKHRIVFNQPPSKIPVAHSVDAPLMGNGFTGVAISGAPGKQVYYLARNDFWRLKSAFNQSFPAVLGKIEIEIPVLKEAAYKVEQNLYEAKTYSTFSQNDNEVNFKSFVSAHEDFMVIEISLSGEGEFLGKVNLELPSTDELIDNPPFDEVFPAISKSGITDDGIAYISRAFEEDVDIKSKAAAGLTIVGSDSNKFVLKEGSPVTIIIAFSSNFKSDDCLQTVIDGVKNISKEDVKGIEGKHEQWWAEFWGKSWVEIPDKEVEKQYYLSNYTMASCTRDLDFPPSIFGSWITKERPHWNGDYHLNYNHFAPYYGLCSSNHPELVLPCINSMLAQQERGEYYSKKVCGIENGIMLPVGAGPLGIESTRRNELMEKHRKNWIEEGNVEDQGLFYGQKSNSSYALVNMANHFYSTYDARYTAMYYPFVKGVATFWEEYLTYENGRYVIYDDAIHEGTVGTVNPILSLGLVRLAIQTAIDMSAELGLDADKLEKRKHILSHLSDYSYQSKKGKKVFRYTEKGTAWWNDNTLGIQHIYPGGQVGLNSNPELLKIAHNTIDVMQRWIDFNGSNSFFPAAVRVGYNGNEILTQLNKYVNNTYPNGFQLNNPHGIENMSTVPNTINKMMCMGHGGLLRVFPVWPHEEDASFYQLRAQGAFLVSSEIKNGNISEIEIVSEQGKNCKLLNPWPGKKVDVRSNYREKRILSGEVLKIETQQKEELVLTQVND